MTAAMLFEEALKLPERERESLCDRLELNLRRATSPHHELHAEMQERIKEATERPEDSQSLDSWREEVLRPADCDCEATCYQPPSTAGLS